MVRRPLAFQFNPVIFNSLTSLDCLHDPQDTLLEQLSAHVPIVTDGDDTTRRA
jgi:hypothetical protein